jgi:hypothetical protein
MKKRRREYSFFEKRNLVIFLVFVLLLLFVFILFSIFCEEEIISDEDIVFGDSEEYDLSFIKEACVQFGGIWYEEFKECESISEINCVELGGDFDLCASACRHDPDAEVCTMQCVLVCSF